jgi:hypothetical protein
MNKVDQRDLVAGIILQAIMSSVKLHAWVQAFFL